MFLDESFLMKVFLDEFFFAIWMKVYPTEDHVGSSMPTAPKARVQTFTSWRHVTDVNQPNSPTAGVTSFDHCQAIGPAGPMSRSTGPKCALDAQTSQTEGECGSLLHGRMYHVRIQ